MKTALIFLALLAPGAALAYPNPNVTPLQTAADMVETLWPQPYGPTIVLADATQAPTGQ